MKTTTETAWASELQGQTIRLRCLTGSVTTVADPAALQRRVDRGEGDLFEAATDEVQPVSRGRCNNTGWTVALAHATGPAGDAYVPILLVARARRVRVIDGRASRDRLRALAHAHDFAGEIRAGKVTLRSRKRRASSTNAMSALVNSALAVALDASVDDLRTHLRLLLADAHETDVTLAAMFAGRVRELLGRSGSAYAARSTGS